MINLQLRQQAPMYEFCMRIHPVYFRSESVGNPVILMYDFFRQTYGSSSLGAMALSAIIQLFQHGNISYEKCQPTKKRVLFSPILAHRFFVKAVMVNPIAHFILVPG